MIYHRHLDIYDNPVHWWYRSLCYWIYSKWYHMQKKSIKIDFIYVWLKQTSFTLIMRKQANFILFRQQCVPWTIKWYIFIACNRTMEMIHSKCLGVIIDCWLNWPSHITYINRGWGGALAKVCYASCFISFTASMLCAHGLKAKIEHLFHLCRQGRPVGVAAYISQSLWDWYFSMRCFVVEGHTSLL